MTDISHNLKRGLDKERTYFIAEVGTNHGCELDRALELVAACGAAGADGVKFQSWKVDDFQNSLDRDDAGQWTQPSAAFEILSKYQLPDEWHAPLADACREAGVDFLSAAFDPERARFLKEHGVAAIKVASGDLSYLELLETISGLDLPVVLSTGMGNLDEVKKAVASLGAAADKLAILHCVGDYPPDPADANIRAVASLQEAFGTAVGWSDHYLEDTFALASVALGGTFIEKHVTLSRENSDPDAPFAQTPAEFGALIQKVRGLEAGLGDGVKRCAKGEEGGRIFGRRSLFAARDLAAGTVLTREDINIVRPALGDFFAGDTAAVIGRTLTAPVKRGNPLSKAAMGDAD